MARRTRMTRPYPVNTLEEVLPIAETIQAVNGGHPVPIDLLAEALGTTLKSSAFVQRLGSSARYGITIGSHTSEQIELTMLGESLTAPRDPEERSQALKDAAMEPEVFGRFYGLHAGKPLPEIPYASNTLVRELGVRHELTEECLRIIRSNGLLAGIISDRSGSLFVDDQSETELNVQERQFQTPTSYESSSEDRVKPNEEPFVLVVSADGDQTARKVADLVETLSIPVRAVEIDAQVPQVISPAISAALRSARGCIFVWPESDQLDDGKNLLIKTWMIMGAACFQMGRRVVVVADSARDGELAPDSVSEALEVVDPQSDGGLFPEIMSAMVRTSIVQVSFG